MVEKSHSFQGSGITILLKNSTLLHLFRLPSRNQHEFPMSKFKENLTQFQCTIQSISRCKAVNNTRNKTRD